MIKTLYKDKSTIVTLEDGIVVKKSGTMGQMEAEIQKKAWKLGIAPEVYSFSANTIKMEYIKGRELDQYIKSPNVNRTKTKKLIRIALDTLYNNGISHNDLTGRDIIITNDGKVKIIDYGHSTLYDGPVPKNIRYYGVLHNF